MTSLKTQKLTGSFLGKTISFEVFKNQVSVQQLMAKGAAFRRRIFEYKGFSFISHELLLEDFSLVMSLEFTNAAVSGLVGGQLTKTTFATWSKKLMLGPFSSPFQREVLVGLLKHSQRPVKSMDYGTLAKLSSHEGAARAAASVMAKNPWPIIFPCHRVLPKNGKSIGEYGGGQIENGIQIKAALLRIDGLESSLPDGLLGAY